MGLASLLLGEQNPFAQWAGQNQNLLAAIGGGLGQGQNIQSGLSAGLAQVPQAKALDYQANEKIKADKKIEAQLSSSTLYLRRKHPDLADKVEAGLPISDAWNEAMRREQPNTSVNEYDSRFQAGQEYGLEGDALNTFALTGSIPGTNRSNVTYGLTPIWGTFDDGTQGYGVQGSDGTFKRVETSGFQPSNPYDVSAQKAAGTAIGKNIGGAQFDLPSAQVTTEQTLRAIQDVRDQKKGLEEQFGNFLGIPQQALPAMWGSDKAKFQVASGRLTNRAFLEAREMLRGGGQITDFESKKAESAITSLEDAMQRGDRDQYLKALDDFEQAVRDGFAKLQAQASMMPGLGGAPVGGGNRTSTGVSWSVEP